MAPVVCKGVAIGSRHCTRTRLHEGTGQPYIHCTHCLWLMNWKVVLETSRVPSSAGTPGRFRLLLDLDDDELDSAVLLGVVCGDFWVNQQL